MSKLNARLTKLEQRKGASAQDSSFVIQRQIVWREGDILRSKPAYATVLDESGWKRVAYSEGETEADFDARVDARACGGD